MRVDVVTQGSNVLSVNTPKAVLSQTVSFMKLFHLNKVSLAG